jgi:hypothetical protein
MIKRYVPLVLNVVYISDKHDLDDLTKLTLTNVELCYYCAS